MIKTFIFAIVSFISTIIFIILKQKDIIDWTWWYVFLPIIVFYFIICSYIVYRAIKEERIHKWNSQ